MIKIIRRLTAVILLATLSLIIILGFNPLNLRTKIVGTILNSYLSSTLPDYTPLNTQDLANPDNTDKHPLLNDDQEKKLESFSVNIEKLPPSITPSMQECFIEKLGKERADEIAGGDTPSALEFFKTKECIGK